MAKRVKVPTGAAHYFRLKETPIDQSAQAATLQEAAKSGVPFCEE